MSGQASNGAGNASLQHSNGDRAGNGHAAAAASSSSSFNGQDNASYVQGSSSSNGTLANGKDGTNGNGAVSDLATLATATMGAVESLEDDRPFVPLYEGSHLDRREFIRITLQSLRELGYESSAKSLEAESKVTLEHASIVAFRKAILAGDWRNAERLLIDGLRYGASRAAAVDTASRPVSSSAISSPNLDLVLREPRVRGLDYIKFLIYQQRYLELLEAKQTSKALSVLRDRLAPLNHGSARLHQLSSLVICASPEELRARANWLGSGLASRRKLLEDIESAISPSVMIPSRRLPQLLEQAQELQKARDPFYNLPLETRLSLYVDHQSNRQVFPTHNVATLTGHTDEVWHVAFSNDGTKLASVGKDKMVLVWSVGGAPTDFAMIRKLGPLSGNTCHVAFSPDDKQLLSTSDDGEVVLWDLVTEAKKELKAHAYTVGSASWLPNGQGFVTGGMDCKVIFWSVDGKQRHTWSTSPFRVQALDVSPDGRYLVAISHRYLSAAATSTAAANASASATSATTGASSSGHAWNDATTSPGMNEEDWTLARSEGGDDAAYLGSGSRTMGDERFQLHFYDVQRQEELGSIFMDEEMTSVAFSQDSRQVLINQRPNEAQLWDVERQSLIHRFIGHRIQQYVIRSCFGGAEKSFVISGSEDGFIYVYHRRTGQLLERLRGHSKGSVNSVAWHPQQYSMAASCGDDGTVRIWSPPPESEMESGNEARRRNGTSNVVTTDSGLQPALAVSIFASGNGYPPFGGGISTSGGAGSAPTLPPLSHDREREPSSDAMGPTPFPWATSPRGPASPSASQRRNRRHAAASRRSTIAPSLTATGDSVARRMEHDDDDDDDDDDEEDDDEDDDEEEEEEEEEDDGEDNVMEE